MCRPFSCLIDEDCQVYWKMGIDSHEELCAQLGLFRRDNRGELVHVEVVPDLGEPLLTATRWRVEVEEDNLPKWWSDAHTTAAIQAQGVWWKRIWETLPPLEAFKSGQTSPIQTDPCHLPETTPEVIANLKMWGRVSSQLLGNPIDEPRVTAYLGTTI